MDDDESRIAEKYEALRGVMDEQMRRLWAATEARALGYGGVSTVARAVGLTRPVEVRIFCQFARINCQFLGTKQ